MEMLNRHPLWKQAVDDAVREFNYGDMIPFSWLYNAFNMHPLERGTAKEFQKAQFAFLGAIENFKLTMLEEHNMYLHSMRGEGYVIVNPVHQSDLAWDGMKKKMYKAFSQATMRLTCIDITMLDSSEKTNNSNKLNTLAALRLMSRRKVNGADDLQINGETQVPNKGTGNGDTGETSEPETS